MALKNEDAVPESYPYFWDKESSDLSLKDFLTKACLRNSNSYLFLKDKIV
jgi:hypothetical protein